MHYLVELEMAMVSIESRSRHKYGKENCQNRFISEMAEKHADKKEKTRNKDSKLSENYPEPHHGYHIWTCMTVALSKFKRFWRNPLHKTTHL